MQKLLLIILLLLSGNLHAMWAKMSDCELINRSAHIVLGTYSGAPFSTTVSAQEVDINAGMIQVDQVLLGSSMLKQVYIEQPDISSGIISSDMIFYKKGQTGLWYLFPSAYSMHNVFIANTPQHFLANPDIDSIKATIKQCS